MVIGDKDAEAMEGEKSQKELDEEIKKKKERQVKWLGYNCYWDIWLKQEFRLRFLSIFLGFGKSKF